MALDDAMAQEQGGGSGGSDGSRGGSGAPCGRTLYFVINDFNGTLYSLLGVSNPASGAGGRR